MALTTDATPRIHLTPAQVLQDEHRMKRLKAALSDVIFAYAVEEDALNILNECLKVCGGSFDTLSNVLQTKFFAGHTPFYWAITNRHSMPGTPPLLTELLDVCSTLTQETQNDIIDAFYREYDSDLYSAIKGRLTDVPLHEEYNKSDFFEREEDRPRLTASSFGVDHPKGTVDFTIPQFFKRLLVDGEVCFEFLMKERLWRLKAVLREGGTKPGYAHWTFELSMPRCKYNSDANKPWRIDVEIKGPEGTNKIWRVYDSTHYSYTTNVVSATTATALVCREIDQLPRFFCNSYTANKTGQLCGTIVVTRND